MPELSLINGNIAGHGTGCQCFKRHEARHVQRRFQNNSVNHLMLQRPTFESLYTRPAFIAGTSFLTALHRDIVINCYLLLGRLGLTVLLWSPHSFWEQHACKICVAWVLGELCTRSSCSSIYSPSFRLWQQKPCGPSCPVPASSARSGGSF